MDFKYHGIVLGKNDIGEADRLYTIYTKESGKVRLLGKGVRRPNARLAGNLEPLTHSEIFFARSRGRGNITGAIGVNFFPNIKNSLMAVKKTFFVLEIFARLIADEEKDEEIFRLFLEYLEAMEASSGRDEERDNIFDILSFGFLFRLLGRAGYRVETGKCASCKGKIGEEISFSPRAGGILCGVCASKEREKIRITQGAVKIMRILEKNRIGNFSKIIAEKKDADSLGKAVIFQIRWIL